MGSGVDGIGHFFVIGLAVQDGRGLSERTRLGAELMKQNRRERSRQLAVSARARRPTNVSTGRWLLLRLCDGTRPCYTGWHGGAELMGIETTGTEGFCNKILVVYITTFYAMLILSVQVSARLV